MATSRKDIIEFILEISKDTLALIEKICEENNMSKSVYLKRSLALMAYTLEKKKKNLDLVFVDKKGEKQETITGI